MANEIILGLNNPIEEILLPALPNMNQNGFYAFGFSGRCVIVSYYDPYIDDGDEYAYTSLIGFVLGSNVPMYMMGNKLEGSYQNTEFAVYGPTTVHDNFVGLYGAKVIFTEGLGHPNHHTEWTLHKPKQSWLTALLVDFFMEEVLGPFARIVNSAMGAARTPQNFFDYVSTTFTGISGGLEFGYFRTSMVSASSSFYPNNYILAVNGSDWVAYNKYGQINLGTQLNGPIFQNDDGAFAYSYDTSSETGTIYELGEGVIKNTITSSDLYFENYYFFGIVNGSYVFGTLTDDNIIFYDSVNGKVNYPISGENQFLLGVGSNFVYLWQLVNYQLIITRLSYLNGIVTESQPQYIKVGFNNPENVGVHYFLQTATAPDNQTFLCIFHQYNSDGNYLEKPTFRMFAIGNSLEYTNPVIKSVNLLLSSTCPKCSDEEVL